MNDYDILVIGGGIAGAMATVAAAREGAKVLLIEENGCLGGSLTSCGTGPMMTFHAGERQVVKGLGEELISRLVAKGLSVGHIPDSTGYTYTVTPFDAEGMKLELELMVIESGADILYHSTLCEVSVSDNILKSVKFMCCGQKMECKAKVFIDTTGDSDLTVMAGVPYFLGRDSDNKNQPMTTNFKVSGVDISKIRKIMETNPNMFPFLEDKPGLEKRAIRLSCSGFQEIMKKGMADHQITFDRDIVLFFETNNPNEVIVNMTRILNLNPVSPTDLSKAEIEGRRQVWELFAFMKKNIPGFENCILLSSGPNVGIRSSRRMKAIYNICAEDILKETIFEDSISAFGYPIDIHSADGVNTDTTFLRYGGWYTIPYRCLINDKIPNIMAAGRNVGSTFEAHASLRCSPNCASMGQAAGVAASIAVNTKLLPTQISIDVLQSRLKKQGAFLGE